MVVPPDHDDSMDPRAPGSWFDSDPPRTTLYTSETSNSRNHRSSYPSRGGSGARSRPRTQSGRLSRDELRDFAELTLLTIEEGEYKPPGSRTPYDLEARVNYTNENTSYYSPDDAAISGWTSAPLQRLPVGRRTQITIKQYSTLVGARVLHGRLVDHPEGHRKIGVLNFASAKKPGGGFLNGSQAQEESIARSSTLYPSLVTPVATQFYAHYADDPDNPYYTHAMVYSPDVVLIRNDKGEWKKPIRVDVLTCAAVNAGEIRKKLNWEEDMRLLRARVRAAEAARAREADRRRQATEAREAERRQQREEHRRRVMAEERAKAADARRKREQEEMKKAKQDTGNDGEGTSGQMDGMDVDEPSLKEPVDAEMAEVSAEAKDSKSEFPTGEATKPSQRDTVVPTTEPTSSSTPQIDLVPTNSNAGVQLNEQISDAPLGRPDIVAPPNTIDSPHETRATDIPSPATPPPEEPSLANLLEMAETDINKEMYERIGRLLYLFHTRGAQHLVLGSFGTGVFQNDVDTIAGIFFDLLANPNGLFYNIFESVVFAILDAPTVRGFTKVFKSAGLDMGDDAEDAIYVESSTEETQDGKGEEVPAQKGALTTEGAGERHSDETSTRTIAAPDTEASVNLDAESKQATQSEDAYRDHTIGAQPVDSAVDQVKGLDKELPATPTLAPV